MEAWGNTHVMSIKYGDRTALQWAQQWDMHDVVEILSAIDGKPSITELIAHKRLLPPDQQEDEIQESSLRPGMPELDSNTAAGSRTSASARIVVEAKVEQFLLRAQNGDFIGEGFHSVGTQDLQMIGSSENVVKQGIAVVKQVAHILGASLSSSASGKLDRTNLRSRKSMYTTCGSLVPRCSGIVFLPYSLLSLLCSSLLHG